MVSAAPATAMVAPSARARSFVTVAETVTVLSAASTSSFTAVIVTVSPAAVVSPAAITMVPAAPEGTVNDPEPPVTVTVVAAPDGCESRAVTVAAASFSEIEVGETASVTVGGPSSSLFTTFTSSTSPASSPS